MNEKIYYIDLLGLSNTAKEKALEAMVDHSKKTGLLVESFKSSNSPDFCGKPEVTAYNCRYYIIGRHGIFCSNTLGHIYGPSLSKLCLYQWVDMFAEKEEATKVDNIAIDCTGFNKVKKQYVQEAFFKLGHKWKEDGYHHLYGDGYTAENGKLSYYIYPINEEDKAHFNRLKFLTFNELMELAGCPWRMSDDGTLGQTEKSEQTYNCIKEFTKQSSDVGIVSAEDDHDPHKTDRSKPRNKYDREILPGVFVDVYDVLSAFKTDSPAIDHAAKKLLAPGKRGHKDRVTDLKEAIASIENEIAKINEWSN